MSFINKNHAHSRVDSNLTRAALFFALVGDYFLVVQNKNYEWGIFFFILCQLLHFYRFTNIKTAIKLSAILPVIYFLLPHGIKMYERIGIIYSIVILFALGGAIQAFNKRKYEAPNRHFIVIAMLFFVICDVNVLLFNINALAHYKAYFLYFIWIFYYPALLLLSLSHMKLK